MIKLKVITAEEIMNMPPEPHLVVIKDGVLSFVNHNYEIEMSRIKNRTDILKWTHHLILKTWMTLEAMEQFIRLTCAYRDVPIYGKD